MNNSFFNMRRIGMGPIAKRSGSSLLVVAAILAAPVQAQDVGADETGGTADEIIVTGTLIANPNLEKSTPVAVISSDEIDLRQVTVAEHLLRDLPGSVPGVGSAVSFGSRGAATANLRGLGAGRNLVLLDGNRVVPTDLGGFADLNNIPLGLVERVDVLTGGASTTYGADAVAGVVNFVTRRNFSGFELVGTQTITERGDAPTSRVEALFGGNFDDGRGNIVVGLGYQHSDPLYQPDRSFGEINISSVTGNTSGSTWAVPGAFSAPGLGTRQFIPTTGALSASTTRELFNVNPYQLYQTPFQRENVYAAARYEVIDDVEVYAQALYSKNSVKLSLAPSGIAGETMVIPYNNPFLPAAARAQFCAANGVTVAQCNAAATATSPTDPNYRTFTTAAVRRFAEGGARETDIVTRFNQYVGGLRGKLSSSLKFDVGVSYGESERTDNRAGQVRRSRVQQALLATNAGTCLTATDGCVPLNVFGAEGSITPAMLAFLTATTTTQTRTTLLRGYGLINGDIGVASPLADTPISLALGTEYRRYTASTTGDALSKTSGEIIGEAAVTDVFGKYDVSEVFGEIIAPLIEDKPFFHKLTLEAGVRYSDYSTAGSNWTWKVGGTWEPLRGFSLRGNYQQASRAPNIGELYQPQVTGTGQLKTDPCQFALPVGNAALTAICIAQGAPANQIGSINEPGNGSVNVTTGGNRALGVETAKSWTVGAIFEPAFVPGLTVSLDYYNITIEDAISTPTIGDVIAACFDPAFNPRLEVTAACSAIRRNTTTGQLSGPTATTAGLPLTLSNLGWIRTDGIDLAVNYRRDLGFARLALSFNGNWTGSSKFRATPSSITRECVGYYSTNCNAFGYNATTNGAIQPEFSWNQRTTLSFGPADVSLLWRHIDGVRYEPIATSTILPQFARIKAHDYFDLSSRVEVSERLALTFTVTNLLDKQPPIVGANAGPSSFNAGNTYPSTYDVLGRRYSVSARVTF